MRYIAYGLNIDSELSLPELLPGSSGCPDVNIRFGPVSPMLPNPSSTDEPVPLVQRPFLLSVSGVARYLVVNGQDIWIEPDADSLEADMRVFLLGSAFGALLHQRHLLPMHASAIQTPRGAVLFVGPSGQGKSTLLAALLQRGYAMLADDVSAIALDAEGRPIAFPAFPYMRLWADAATHLQQPVEGGRRVQPLLDKYLLPVTYFCTEPLPVYAIYDLMIHQAPDIRLESVDNRQCFEVLANNTYRSEFLPGLRLSQTHFQLVAAVATRVPIRRITRPRSPFLLDDLVQHIEAELTRTS